MNSSALFSKDDAVAYAILHAMLQSPDLTITKPVLTNDFGLSAYQINKHFTALNADLKLACDTPVYLTEGERGVWQAHGLTTYGWQQIGLLYLQRASLFLVFEYEYLYADQLPKQDYIAQHAISTPSYYLAANALNQVLKDADFTTPSGSFTDAEYTLRLHLFELYYTAYTGVATPFPQLASTVAPLIALCRDFVGTGLRPSQVTKLSLFLKLWLLRLKNGGRLGCDLLTSAQLDDSAQAFVGQVQQQLKHVPGMSAREATYLYAFLVAQRFLPLATHPALKAAFPAVDELTGGFLTALTAQADLIDAAQLDLARLQASLDQIHLEFALFFIEPTTFIDPEQIAFFQGLYPGFDRVIAGYIQALQPKLPLSQSLQTNLYFSYMFALISAVPPRAMNDEVFICVDFSQGTLYSDYVVSTLAAFSHAHLVIETNVSDATDIYISDFRSELVTQPQVIWQNPPTPNDWSNLADLILAIKQQKTSTLLH